MRRPGLIALFTVGCFSEAPPVTSGDGSEGSSGTADASSSTDASGDATSVTDADSSSSDASSNDSSAADCGNGVPEGSEACDDANLEDHDGCTSACELGARIVTMYEVPSPEIVIGEDPVGETPYDESCYDPVDGEPRLVGRLYGRTGGSKTDTWTVSSGGNCDRLELDWPDEVAAIVTVDTADSLPELGDHDGLFGDWEVQCEAGTVPVGIAGRTFEGNTPDNIVALRLECAPLTIDAMVDGGVVIGAREYTHWVPDGDGAAIEMAVACPEGAVMVGFRAFGDIEHAALYRFGVNCAVPVVEFGPAPG